MKKILACILCLLMLSSLLSCAGSKETATNTNKKEPASSPSVETPDENAGTSSESKGTSTPTPTPTPVDPLEKKKNNTATKTEDDLDVIHVGLYEFALADGRKLAYTADGKLTLVSAETSENTEFLVSFQNAGTDKTGRAGVRYILYCGDSVSKSVYCLNNSLSVKDSTDNNMSYNWNIEEHEDGTVSLRNVSNKRYIIVDSDKPEGSMAPDATAQKDFKMNLISEGTSCFHQTISEKGNVILRINDKVKVRGDMSYERQAKLANDLQIAYETYYELTDYLVWDSIIARVYRSEPYFGYIYPNWNVISFDLTSAIQDLGKAVLRDDLGINDWNFCLLHEMGHMFDAYRGWKFHAEFCTNMKVAYVLYKNSDVDARAATSGYSYKDCFDGAHIKDMWNKIPVMTSSTGFNLDRLLYIFVSYAETIGWDNVKKAYHEIQHLPTQETDKYKCFELFTNTMAKYAPNNLNVKDTMKEGELDIVLAGI